MDGSSRSCVAIVIEIDAPGIQWSCRSVTADPTVERERLLNQMLRPLGAGVRHRTLDKDKIHHAQPRSIRSSARLRLPAKPTRCTGGRRIGDSVLHQSIRCQSGGAVQSERMSSRRVTSIDSALFPSEQRRYRGDCCRRRHSELLHPGVTQLTTHRDHLLHDDRR